MENKELKIAFYDACSYDKESFSEENKNFLFNIDFFDFHLTEKTGGKSGDFRFEERK